jgi:hypothetical protein
VSALYGHQQTALAAVKGGAKLLAPRRVTKQTRAGQPLEESEPQPVDA